MAFTPTDLCRRRIKTPFLVKYLEGVPTPTDLIDHLAGGNLRSSSSVPFSTTVPRYLHHRHGQPGKGPSLSKLFFHHVLYPAGGARLPYQAVVIREGRTVAPSRPQQVKESLTPTTAASKGWHHLHKYTPKDPQAVPAAQLGSVCPPPDSLRSVEGEIFTAAWVRHDPARRPYFYAPHTAHDREANGFAYKMGSHTLVVGSPPKHHGDAVAEPLQDKWQQQLPRSRGPQPTVQPTSRAVPSASGIGTDRPNGDSPLEPLCGVVEAALGVREWASLAPLLVNSHGGLRGTAAQLEEAEGNQSAYLQQLLRDASAERAPVSEETARNAVDVAAHIYVQCYLPMEAVVQMPVAGTQSEELWCRLAGGVEPVVNFAVGVPLRTPSQSCPTPASYRHITCLMRVEGQGRVHPRQQPASSNSTPQPLGGNPSQSGPPGLTTEPGRMGVALDPAVPLTVRTMSERHSAGSSVKDSSDGQRQHVGTLCREDAEVYLLPQRELLLTLYVDPSTQALCRQHNAHRLAKQVRLGHAPAGATRADGSWGPIGQRMTAARVAQTQYANAEAAMHTAGGGGGEVSAALLEAPSYEVRALPGDVIYIPRGWAFTVRRIVGMAIVNAAVAPSAASTGERRSSSSSVRAVMPLKVKMSSGGAHHPRGGASVPSDPRLTSIGDVCWTGVAVDALLLNYHPYPVLTAQQAEAYVPANYVTGGINEFYEKGGNDAWRRYE